MCVGFAPTHLPCFTKQGFAAQWRKEKKKGFAKAS